MKKAKKILAIGTMVIMGSLAVTACGSTEIKKSDSKLFGQNKDGSFDYEECAEIISDFGASIEDIKSVTLSGKGEIEAVEEVNGKEMSLVGSGSIDTTIGYDPIAGHADASYEYGVKAAGQNVNLNGKIEGYLEYEDGKINIYYNLGDDKWKKENNDAEDMDIDEDIDGEIDGIKKQIASLDMDEVKEVISKLNEVEGLEKIIKISEEKCNGENCIKLAFTFDNEVINYAKENNLMSEDDISDLNEKFDDISFNAEMYLSTKTILPVKLSLDMNATGKTDMDIDIEIKKCNAEINFSYDDTNKIDIPEKIKDSAEKED